MKKNKKESVFPTSLDEVPVRGKGGLRKSFLYMTIAPMVLMGLIFLTLGSMIYSRALQKQTMKELENVADSVITYYEFVHPGEYSVYIDDKKEKAYLKKGTETISDETSWIDETASQSGTDITIFFYNTRMMTTVRDSDGKRINLTTANEKITNEVLNTGESKFYDNVEIEKVRYCVMYKPILDSSDAVIGMIGVGQPYSVIQGYVNRLCIINVIIILITMIFAALWMVRYSNRLASSIGKLVEFLGDMAEGRLDTELDRDVLDREDEIGDMGRYTLYVRGSLKKLVEKDPLTNLYNRRSGQNRMDQIRRRAQKDFSRYSIAIGDIDFFKKVNDTYGHDAGDAVLKEVARILSDNMVGKGIVIRWGGEEFLFVFDHEGVDEAKEHLWDILGQIRKSTVFYDDMKITFTMSYGVIEGSEGMSAGQEITAADELLYYAKSHGRNRVVSIIEKQREEETSGDGQAQAPEAGETANDKNEGTEEKVSKADERWDIYDKDKKITGRTMKRNDWVLKDDEYHLTVLGVVMNREGKFLITKRKMDKAWAPGWWEVSGGAAMAGESSLEAVRREVKEETGLDVTDADGGFFFSYHRENPGEGDNYFVDVYRFVMDFDIDDVHLQEEETDGCRIVTPEEIEELGREGIFLHYDSIRKVFEA